MDAYAGNGTAAARAAGYKGNDQVLAVAASRLLKKAEVKAALAARNAKVQAAAADVVLSRHIATRAERQAFWTEVMLDVNEKMADRLRAAELLGKSEADFVERLQHEGKLTLEELVLAAARPGGGDAGR